MARCEQSLPSETPPVSCIGALGPRLQSWPFAFASGADYRGCKDFVHTMACDFGVQDFSSLKIYLEIFDFIATAAPKTIATIFLVIANVVVAIAQRSLLFV